MDILEVLGKIKLDASDYKKGLNDAENASTQATKNISQAFDTVEEAIENSTGFMDALRNAYKVTSTEMVNESKKASNGIKGLKTQIEVMKSAVKASEDEVSRLSAELAKSAKETGVDSDETKELAEELSKAKSEMKQNQDELKGLEKELKEYGQAAEEAKEKSSESGEKIKHAFGTVAKAGVMALKTAVDLTAKAIAAAAGGVGLLVKQSVSAYGEYQQLAGGAQKIFNEMDFKVIEQDAKMAFRELNLSMNEYMDSINKVGATFAATMSDQEAYETARKGMLAISDFATGTGGDINELNEKFKMITRATSSYQSIADQFSGILPATSKDFLAQAQAVGLLSTEYEKLTDVPIDEYQKAISGMLEEGVRAQGLANNALNESTNTLTGSMAMTKAAWENLVMSLADKDANIVEYMDRFVYSASATFENMLPVVEQALNGVAKLIDDIVPKIMDKFSDLIGEGGVAENLLTAGKNIIESISKGIDENIDGVVDFAERILDMFIETLDTVLPTLATLGIKIVETLGSAIINNLDKILETGGKILQLIVKGLSDHASDMVSAAIKIIESLGNFVKENADLLIDAATQILLAIVKGVSENAGELIALGMAIIQALADSLLENIDVIIEAVPEIIQGFIDGLVDNLPAMTKAWVKLMDTFEIALPQIIDSILAVLPQIMDIMVEYWLGDGAQQTFKAAVIMFGSLTKAFLQIGASLLASIGTAIRSYVSTIAGAAGELHAAAMTGFNSIWTAAKTALANALSAVRTAMSNIGSTIRSTFSNLISSAFTWGKDMLSNFVNGIKQKINDLKNTISSVAQIAKNYMGHSHPTEGAMKDDYKWMPDMMDLFIKGIKDNEDKLQEAAYEAFNFKDAVTAPSMSGAMTASGKSLGETALEKLLSNLQINMYNTTEIDGQAIKKDSYKYTVTRLGDETRAVRVAMGGF